MKMHIQNYMNVYLRFFVFILMYNKPSVAISGISEELYEQLVRQEEDIAFYCKECGLPADESSVPQIPNFESTRISAIDEEQPAEPESQLSAAIPESTDDAEVSDHNDSSFTISEEGSIVQLDTDQSFDVSQHLFDMPDIIQEK